MSAPHQHAGTDAPECTTCFDPADLLTRRPDLVDLAAVGINRALALREEA